MLAQGTGTSESLSVANRCINMDNSHPGPLAGRHALVTGAGRGIGAAIGQALARDGARLTLLDRTSETLQQLAGSLPGDGHGCIVADIADPDQVLAAFAQARAERGALRILVNNAGQAESAPFGKTSLAPWQRMLAVNLTGSFLCAQQALPDMLAAGGGRWRTDREYRQYRRTKGLCLYLRLRRRETWRYRLDPVVGVGGGEKGRDCQCCVSRIHQHRHLA